MKHYEYLIVGGGMAADAAARGIRELDGAGHIGVLSADSDPPYTRPNLSKGLWKGRPMEKVWRKTEETGAEVLLNATVTELDPTNKRVHDARGEEYTYDKLLLATGGTPKRLQVGGDHIIYFRSLQDYRRLRKLADERERFLVIGAGFIGSEIAAALTMVGRKVTMLVRDRAIGGHMFPPELADYVNDFYRQKGVDLITDTSAASIQEHAGRYTVRTDSGRSLEVGGIVAGIGIRPNVELAQAAGIKVEDGVVVDEHLRTSAEDIYAAGDAANFFHSALGRRLRVEHEDNALDMGKLAGRHMTGADQAYTHAPMFYSDLFDLGYEAVGDTDSKLRTVSDWQDGFKKGVIYYLQDGRVRGVLLWNVWKKVDQARALMAEAGDIRERDLKGRIAD